MLEYQETIQAKLLPAMQQQESNAMSPIAILFGGLFVGTLIGLVFASYLVKIYRSGTLKAEKEPNR